MLGLRSARLNFVTSLAAIILTLLTALISVAQTPQPLLDKPAVESNSPAPESVTKPPIPAANIKEEATAETVKTDTAATKETTVPAAAPAAMQAQCPAGARAINADVVAIPKAIMLNRLGATIPNAFVFALRRDTVGSGNNIQLRPGKRPRPLVLRANVGDCLRITFTNAIPLASFADSTPQSPQVGTTKVSLHIQGQEWANGSTDDGSFVGGNPSSLASAPPSPSPSPAPSPGAPQTYTLFVKNEGTFLLYTMGDTEAQPTGQLSRGLFGALNVQPGRRRVVSQPGDTSKSLPGQPGRIPRAHQYFFTPGGQPTIDYNAVYPPGNAAVDSGGHARVFARYRVPRDSGALQLQFLTRECTSVSGVTLSNYANARILAPAVVGPWVILRDTTAGGSAYNADSSGFEIRYTIALAAFLVDIPLVQLTWPVPRLEEEREGGVSLTVATDAQVLFPRLKRAATGESWVGRFVPQFHPVCARGARERRGNVCRRVQGLLARVAAATVVSTWRFWTLMGIMVAWCSHLPRLGAPRAGRRRVDRRAADGVLPAAVGAYLLLVCGIGLYNYRRRIDGRGISGGWSQPRADHRWCHADGESGERGGDDRHGRLSLLLRHQLRVDVATGLDRLGGGGPVRRATHPADRRADPSRLFRRALREQKRRAASPHSSSW